jgi:hypothetical protein
VITELKQQHREIEAALERGEPLRELLERHFRREEEFLNTLAEQEPMVAAKLRSQHEEALEILGHLDTASPADAAYLQKRFTAIVQHNIIEEERDVFPRYMPNSTRLNNPAASAATPRNVPKGNS